MTRRTLVVIIGQLRAAPVTFEPFRRNVLEALDADLAVCITDDDSFDVFHPFYQAARYRWVAHQPEDIADAFDAVQSHLGATEDWRVICDVGGHWIGGIKQSGQHTLTALQIYLHWFMINNIEAAGLRDVYNTFVITRSDFLFTCPHPPIELLDPEFIWLPNGEDYGGFTPGLADRHRVVSSKNLEAAVDLITPLLLSPQDMRRRMISKPWNMEQYFALCLDMRGLFTRVRRFPYIMFLVRTEADRTNGSEGRYEADVAAFVKYPSEHFSARSFEPYLRDAADWRTYFALDAWIGRSPTGFSEVMNEPLFKEGAEERKSRAMSLFAELWPKAKAAWSDSGGLEALRTDERSRFLIFALRHVAAGETDALQQLWVADRWRRGDSGPP